MSSLLSRSFVLWSMTIAEEKNIIGAIRIVAKKSEYLPNLLPLKGLPAQFKFETLT